MTLGLPKALFPSLLPCQYWVGVFESHWLPERPLSWLFGVCLLLSTCPRGTLLEGSLHGGFDQCLHQGPPHLSLWARLGEPDLPTAALWTSCVSHAIPLLHLSKSGSLGSHLTARPPAITSPPIPFSAFSPEHGNSTPAHLPWPSTGCGSSLPQINKARFPHPGIQTLLQMSHLPPSLCSDCALCPPGDLPLGPVLTV